MPNESVIPSTERRSLRYDFTAVEIHDLSMKLAGKTRELASVTEEKSSVVAKYGAQLKEITATQNTLSNQITDGWEFRQVECTVEFNKPTTGMKTLTRSDNKQTIVERMESWEFNLFTQAAEEDAKLLGNSTLDGAPKPEKKQRQPRKNKHTKGTDILDEIEGMTPPPSPQAWAEPDDDMDDDSDLPVPDDLPFL